MSTGALAAHVAQFGQTPLVERLDRNIDRLVRLMADMTDERRLRGPVAGSSVRLADYLATRTVEMVVHVDDLAAGLGLAVAPPPNSVELAADALMALARRRVDDLTVVQALTRPERRASSA